MLRRSRAGQRARVPPGLPILAVLFSACRPMCPIWGPCGWWPDEAAACAGRCSSRRVSYAAGPNGEFSGGPKLGNAPIDWPPSTTMSAPWM
jgi:hypothetical protein